jgi:hypothetical protein
MSVVAFGQLRAAFDRSGYRFNERGLNLVGIRNTLTGQIDKDTFNDQLVLMFYQDRRPCLLTMAMTTDPGRAWRVAPITEAGTAIMVAGQYRELWRIGSHRGRYAALVQNAPCEVYRDRNGDAALDFDELAIERGQFGINLHRTAINHSPQLVDRWSAGCQVVADYDDFSLAMALCRKYERGGQDTFDYTLFEAGRLWIR